MITEEKFAINRICSAVGVSRGSYYNWKNHPGQIDTDKYLIKDIESIALEFPCYGYRRITHELRRRKVVANSKKVRRIMKENNLLCRRKKAFKPVTTNSNHGYRLYQNLIKDIEATGLNQVWVSDITYIQLPGEFVYLAAILDLFSRRCIGWALSRSINSQLTIDALNMALQNRRRMGFDNLIHHSDGGVQYASNEYVNILVSNGIRISMAIGNAYENAHAESFNKTLKVEEVYINEYETFEEAYRNIKHFIELVYNKKRLHSSLGYIPPEEFEREVLAKI